MKIKVLSADKWLSLYVRQHWNWTCAMSGTKFDANARGLHCAHIFSRRHAITRYHPLNLIPLSFGNHQKFDSDHELHRSFAIEIVGENTYEALNRLRNLTVIFSKQGRAEIAAFYKARYFEGGKRLETAPLVAEAAKERGVYL